MYERLKAIAKKAIPPKLLHRYEAELRGVNALLYVGNKVRCNCCGGSFAKWITLTNGDRLCPKCGSLPRTRRLYDTLLHGYLGKDVRVLHFSPSVTLRRRLSQTVGLLYDSTDYAGEFQARYQFDILDIAMPPDTYDLVICYHVLEHITDDRRAMAELYRVLKPGGRALIQTPFQDGAIYEDDTIITPEARLAAFGQTDHVRVYSVAGLAGRLRDAGFGVEVKRFGDDEVAGLRGGEVVLACRKPW